MSATERTLRLLEFVGTAQQAPTHAELARTLGIPKSTLSLMLEELQELDYVRLLEKRYVAGPALYSLSHRLRATIGAVGVRPALEDLVRRTGESAVFSVEVPPHMIPVEQVQTEHPIRYVAELGRPRMMHCTAIGKVMLAFTHRTSRDLKGPLVSLTPRTITDPAVLDEELQRTRELGYALSREESVEGVSSIAAPLLDKRAFPIGAVSITWPSYRMDDPAGQLWPALRNAVRRLGRG